MKIIKSLFEKIICKHNWQLLAKTEDDWGKKVVSDKEYKKKHPLYVSATYQK